MGLLSEKMKALYAELNERVEAVTSNDSTKGDFLQHLFCACG